MTIRRRHSTGPTVVAAPPVDPIVTGPPPADPFVVPPVDTAVAPVAPAAGYVPPGEYADNRFGMGMLLGLVVLLAIGGVIAAWLLTRHHHHAAPVTTTVVVKQSTPAKTVTTATQPPAQLVVPNLIGMAQPDAITSLRNEGLKVRILTVRGPSPAGAVLGETPAPQAKIASGSLVTIRVSNGLATPAKPAATQTTTSSQPPTTQATTTQATSTQATTTQATSTQATTSQQTTTAATPAPPVNATVPDVSGQQVQPAAAALAKAGFPVALAYVGATDPLGTIVAMSPKSGSTAPTTAHITINAASGPGQKQQETVPDATGMTIPQAVAAMQHAGLRLIFLKKTVADRTEAGKIVEQTPAPGKTAPHNAQILVYMGAFKEANH